MERKLRRKVNRQGDKDLLKKAAMDKLDTRDRFFAELQSFEKKNGFVPAPYCNDKQQMIQYESYKKLGPWRNDRKLVKKFERRYR